MPIGGAGAIFVWSVGHLVPTRSVVSGFTLCIIGVLSALVTSRLGVASPGGALVLRTCAGMLVALAVVSSFTGARTSVLPMKVCPVVKSVVAAIFVVATFAG